MEIYSRACSTFLFVIFTPGMFKLHNYVVGIWVSLLIHICFIGSTLQVRTMHWRETTNPARSLRAAHDFSPLGINVSLHFMLNCIWARRPKTWLCWRTSVCNVQSYTEETSNLSFSTSNAIYQKVNQPMTEMDYQLSLSWPYVLRYYLTLLP